MALTVAVLGTERRAAQTSCEAHANEGTEARKLSTSTVPTWR